MPRIHRAVKVAFSDQQMFDLVNDIESYPQFLHWCSGARITSKDVRRVEATINIGLAGFSKSFSTRNTLKEPSRIDMQLVSGPFKRLSGQWVFTRIDDQRCTIALDVDFAMPASPLSGIFSSMFEEMAGSQVTAFLRRAEDVYGSND